MSVPSVHQPDALARRPSCVVDADGVVAYQLPKNLFRYVLSVSWRHQIVLVGLTVLTFLLEIVPLEIQRRVVNNLVKERPFQLVMIFCAAYAGAVLVQGATKLGVNIYRSWVGENSKRDLRRRIIAYLRIARADYPWPGGTRRWDYDDCRRSGTGRQFYWRQHL